MRTPPPHQRRRAGLPAAILAAALLLAPGAASGQVPAQPPDPFQRIFARIYNYDFAEAHALLDEQQRADPANPLVYAVRAAIHLFTEMGRLKILETDFFLDDDNMVDGQGHRLKPDPEVKRTTFAALDEARTRAQASLAKDPNDRQALFAMVMVSGVAADYVGFVERRQWRGLSIARETNKYAQKLLALTPPVYDAYINVGSLEYVIGSLPFFIRWFVRFDRIEGDKRRGIEYVKLVAQHGTYYGPFARVLLAVVSLREGKLEDARQILAQLAVEFPENPLMKRELAKVIERIAAQKAKRR